MAKQKKTKPATAAGENVTSFQVASLNTDLRNRVATVKKNVLAAGTQFGSWRTRCADLASPVMKLFRAIAAHFDTIPGAKTFRFVDFARMIDPALPEKSTEYGNHPTYKTLQYMQQLDRLRERATTAGTTQGAGGARSKALDGLARALKVIAGLTGVDTATVIRDGATEIGLSKNMRTRLMSRIEAVEPLFTVKLHGGKVTAITTVKAAPEPEADAAHPLTQGGKAVHVRDLATQLGVSLAPGKPATGHKTRRSA